MYMRRRPGMLMFISILGHFIYTLVLHFSQLHSLLLTKHAIHAVINRIKMIKLAI